MLRGENANGEIIGTYRSPSYRQMKTNMNPLAGGTVDLRLTGRLHNQLDLTEQSETDFGIFSSVKYASDLADKYGLESFGLNDVEWKEIQDEILAEVLSISFEFGYG